MEVRFMFGQRIRYSQNYANHLDNKKGGVKMLNRDRMKIYFRKAANIIVAFAVFLMVRYFNKLRVKEEAPPAEPTTKECPHCLSTVAIKASRCAFCTSEL